MKIISKKDIEYYIIENEQYKVSDIICPYCKHKHENEDSEFLYSRKIIMNLNVKIVEEYFC